MKTAPPDLQAVLLLRQQASKSSVKKYQAMQNAVCSDGRARGMFQFYGANRTGREAGRIIQLQNLPQNHLPDLEDARELVKSGDLEAVELLYEDVPDTLSQLIRTAFVPKCPATNSSWQISRRLKQESLHGLPVKRGECRRSQTAKTSTVPRLLKFLRRASSQARHQRTLTAERQGRRIGMWLRRLGRSNESHGWIGNV